MGRGVREFYPEHQNHMWSRGERGPTAGSADVIYGRPLTLAALRMSSLSWNPEWPLRFMSNHEFMKEPPNMVTGHRHAVGQKICEKSNQSNVNFFSQVC